MRAASCQPFQHGVVPFKSVPGIILYRIAWACSANWIAGASVAHGMLHVAWKGCCMVPSCQGTPRPRLLAKLTAVALGLAASKLFTNLPGNRKSQKLPWQPLWAREGKRRPKIVVTESDLTSQSHFFPHVRSSPTCLAQKCGHSP